MLNSASNFNGFDFLIRTEKYLNPNLIISKSKPNDLFNPSLKNSSKF